MAGASITLKWNKPIKQIVKDATGGEKLMKFAAISWHRLYYPYIPFYTNKLATLVEYDAVSADTATIEHTQPYAHRQYNGVGFNFRKEFHPLATAKWDQAAKQAGKAEQLAREMQSFIKRSSKQ